MNINSHIIFTSLVIYVFLAIYVLCLDYRVKLNRLFLRNTLCLCIWSLGVLLIYYSPSSESCWLWYRISSIGQCFLSSCILHFFLRLTCKDNLLKKWWIHVILYAPSLFLLYGFLTDNVIVKDFIITVPGYTKLTVNYSFWYFFFSIYNVIYLSLAIAIALKWRSKLKYSFERKQALIIIIPDILSLLGAISIGIALPDIYASDLLLLTPAAAIFGEIGTWYATVKYKMTVFTPSLAAESILNTMVDSVVLVDSELKILTINNETCRVLKYDEEELIGKELKFLFSENEFLSKPNFESLLKNGPVRSLEIKYLSKDAITIPVVFSASEYRDKDGNLIGIVAISRDITERKNTEERMNYLAHHDFLTGLPNRLLFNDRLEQSLIMSHRHSTIAAVILLDVDCFKEVNDVFGHSCGDSLLVQISDRLRSSVRQIDTIARFGGDEFIFVINDLKQTNDIIVVAEKIHKAFLPEFSIDSEPFHISASIGISLYPCDGDNAETLIKNADLAMYSAKSKGKNNYQLYKQSFSNAGSEKLSLENSLRKAIERNEFVLYYQPIVDVDTGKAISMEALVRWQHPEQGLLPPSKFIPFAEESGLISQIGSLVLRAACIQNKLWIDQGLSEIPISVNISPCQFRLRNFEESILNILEDTGLDPRYLELEITESAAVSDTDMIMGVLSRLNEHGITFIINDFGIGYCSLNYLRRFPIKAIKIEGSLIRDVAINPNDAAITTAIFAMAQTMNLKVIAEGVETIEQLGFLRSLQCKPPESMKCYGAQGYYFSRPVPAESISLLLQKQKKHSNSTEDNFTNDTTYNNLQIQSAGTALL